MRKAVTALLTVAAFIAAGAGPTREDLAIKPSGPVMISPWRVAADKPPEPHWDHYRFSAPAYGYCGYYRFGYGCWYAPGYYRPGCW
jgi:hypothetical protein